MTKPKKAPKAKSAAKLKDLKAKKSVKGGFTAPADSPILQRVTEYPPRPAH
jgi:hypothetical protein